MNQHSDLDMTYIGHQVQVSHLDVPHSWMGDDDTVFTVMIDGKKTVVPGIWRAYKTHGAKGIRLVIEAVLDGEPRGKQPEQS